MQNGTLAVGGDVIDRRSAANAKSPTKIITSDNNNFSSMYNNGRGVSYSLGIVVEQVQKRMGATFGFFTIEEDESGELLVRTGMKRTKLELPSRCMRPCSGDCESCPAG